MTPASPVQDLIFRRRGPQDEPGLLALFNEDCFRTAASTREPFASGEDMRLWLDGVAAAQRFEIVALLSDEVVGFAGLYVLGDGQSHSGWLMLGVRQALQGGGIGSILMQMLVATARDFVGLQRLQLTVFSDNPAAIGLYQKFGFAIEGRHPRFARRGDNFVDALTMARLFDADAAEPDAEKLARLRHTHAAWSVAQGGRWIAA